MVTKDFYTTGEVAQIVNISQATVSRKFDSGHFSGKKNPVTGERLISRESLRSFMNQYNLPLKELDDSSKKLILLCSPDDSYRKILFQHFTNDDRVKILTRSSGYEALVLCLTNSTNLFIIDEKTENFSSRAALEALKLAKNNSMKILFLTDSNSEEFAGITKKHNSLIKDHLEPDVFIKQVEIALGIAVPDKPSDSKFDHARIWPRASFSASTDLQVHKLSNQELSDSGNAVVENISFGGAYLSNINLEKGFLPGEAFRFLLKIDHPPLNKWEATCKVARLQVNDSLTAGVKFENISQENKDKITSIFV
jgi:DNA-binding NarL/FixJ family response regulator